MGFKYKFLKILIKMIVKYILKIIINKFNNLIFNIYNIIVNINYKHIILYNNSINFFSNC